MSRKKYNSAGIFLIAYCVSRFPQLDFLPFFLCYDEAPLRDMVGYTNYI